jgi:hypothetical protein
LQENRVNPHLCRCHTLIFVGFRAPIDTSHHDHSQDGSSTNIRPTETLQASRLVRKRRRSTSGAKIGPADQKSSAKKGPVIWAFGRNHCSSREMPVSQPQGKAISPLEKPSSGPQQPTKQRLYWVPVWKSCKSPTKKATEPVERQKRAKSFVGAIGKGHRLNIDSQEGNNQTQIRSP